jgi:peptidoglycan/xylan/chitin deacetylase (PgdA/CDA1 family)
MDFLSRKLHERAGRHGPVMLMYHAVLPGHATPAWPWAVSMRQFRAQLDFLVAEGYSTPTMRDLVAAPHKWPTRTAVITFDDGYTDNLAACEELDKRGMRASFFVVAGSIGREPHWPTDGQPVGRMLNAEELRDMHRKGFEIGSHTVNHAHLPTLGDEELHRELADSRALIETALNAPVTSFAYPYGEWDMRCARAAADTGYAAACTTRTGWALRDGNPYAMRRLTIFNSDSLAAFMRKLSYAANDVRWTNLAKQFLAIRKGTQV